MIIIVFDAQMGKKFQKNTFPPCLKLAKARADQQPHNVDWIVQRCSLPFRINIEKINRKKKLFKTFGTNNTAKWTYNKILKIHVPYK